MVCFFFKNLHFQNDFPFCPLSSCRNNFYRSLHPHNRMIFFNKTKGARHQMMFIIKIAFNQKLVFLMQKRFEEWSDHLSLEIAQMQFGVGRYINDASIRAKTAWISVFVWSGLTCCVSCSTESLLCMIIVFRHIQIDFYLVWFARKWVFSFYSYGERQFLNKRKGTQSFSCAPCFLFFTVFFSSSA